MYCGDRDGVNSSAAGPVIFFAYFAGFLATFAVKSFYCNDRKGFAKIAKKSWPLLEPIAFVHQALQAGFVEQIVGEFFVGKHSKGGTLSVGGHG